MLSVCIFLAWSIAHAAIKYCFKEIDGFKKPPHSTEVIWEAVKEHFNVKNHLEIVDVIYTKFDKAHISGLCKRIAELALEGDPLSKHLFKETGIEIARSIAAVVRQAQPELKQQEGGIHVLCVGSVWLSWNLLREGFEEFLGKTCGIEELSLMRITTIMAVGAAYMAADRLNIELPRDYSKNYEIFYNYKRKPLNNNI